MKPKCLCLLLVACCLAADNNGCNQPRVPPDTYEHVQRQDRYADFTDYVIVDWRHPQGGADRIRERVTVTIIPSRVGAYLVEAPGSITPPFKIFKTATTAEVDPALIDQEVNSSEQPTTRPADSEYTHGFWAATTISVTFSDGKCIEKTIFKVDPE